MNWPPQRDPKAEGGKGGSRSRFTENKTVLSQFTKNKIGISRFTEKKRESLKVTYRYILENYVRLSLSVHFALEEEPFHFPIVSGYEYKNSPQFQNGRLS